MSFGSDFTFTLMNNNLDWVRAGDAAGVTRIGLDLECLNKLDRQGHVGDVMISNHRMSELPAVRSALRQAALFARTDPIHPGSAEQIERLIGEGVDVLMLPMFRHGDEVRTFVDLVDGRARTVLLAETAAALFRIAEVTAIPGVDEIHVGLNDLRLETKIPNHFEIVVSCLMEKASEVVRAAGVDFGFGGVARVDDDRLPVPPDLVIAQYPRLKGQAALLTRAFLPPKPDPEVFSSAIDKARARLDYWAAQSAASLERQRQSLAGAVSTVAL